MRRFPHVVLLAFLTLSTLQGFAQFEPDTRGELDVKLRASVMFMPKYTYMSGEENWSIGAADFNRDGSIDLVSASKSDGNINVHYNDGIGVFSEAQRYYASPNNRAVCVFDMNNDGWQDIASVTSYGWLCVLINDKTGAFRRPALTELMWGAHDISYGDFNMDEKFDIAIATSEEKMVSVYLGDGHGSFTFAKAIRTADKARVVKIADINGDVKPDLIVGCDDDRVYLYTNRGGDEFEYFNYLRCGLANWAIEVADLNGDHLADVAALSYEDRQLCIHYNLGYGKFRTAPCLQGGSHTFDITSGDIDGDGDLDLVACSTTDGAVNAFRNLGNANFESIGSIASGNWNSSVVVADVDRDGALDVATSSIRDNNVNIHLNSAVHLRRKINEIGEISDIAPVKLTGSVLDNATKAPMANINVYLMTLQGEIVQSGITDDKGKYSFLPERGEMYQLLVQPLGMDAQKDTFVMPGYDHTLEMLLRRQQTSSIKGVITDIVSKEPIPFATIDVQDLSSGAHYKIRANDKGEYNQPLKSGVQYVLSASVDGYDTDSREVVIPASGSGGGRAFNKDLTLTALDYEPMQIVLHGNITDEHTQEPLRSALVLVQSADKKLKYSQRTNEKGEYVFTLPEGEYWISVSPSDYYFASHVETLYRSMTQASMRFDAALPKLAKGALIPLRNVRFEANSRTLNAAARRELDRLAELLVEKSFLEIEIGVHAEYTNDDDASHHLQMTQAQAQAIEIYLMQKGIPDSRIESVGYGDKRSIVPNDTPEHREQNRRVELRILK